MTSPDGGKLIQIQISFWSPFAWQNTKLPQIDLTPWCTLVVARSLLPTIASHPSLDLQRSVGSAAALNFHAESPTRMLFDSPAGLVWLCVGTEYRAHHITATQVTAGQIRQGETSTTEPKSQLDGTRQLPTVKWMILLKPLPFLY